MHVTHAYDICIYDIVLLSDAYGIFNSIHSDEVAYFLFALIKLLIFCQLYYDCTCQASLSNSSVVYEGACEVDCGMMEYIVYAAVVLIVICTAALLVPTVTILLR